MSDLYIRLYPNNRGLVVQPASVHQFIASIAIRANEMATIGIKFRPYLFRLELQTTMSAFPHDVLLRKAENYHSADCGRRQ